MPSDATVLSVTTRVRELVVERSRVRVRLQAAAGPVTGSAHWMGEMYWPSVHTVALVGAVSRSTELTMRGTMDRVEVVVAVGVALLLGVGEPVPDTLAEGVAESDGVLEPELEGELEPELDSDVEGEGESDPVLV